MALIKANPIRSVVVVRDDGSVLRVSGAMNGSIEEKFDIIDTGVTPAGVVTRVPTGASTVRIVVHVDRLAGDTCDWSSANVELPAPGDLAALVSFLDTATGGTR